MKKTLLTTLLLFPFFTFAATGSIQSFLTNLTEFLSKGVVPFLLGIAFVFFVFNAIRFFVIGNTVTSGEGSNKKTVGGDRGKARALALYSVLAFVLILTFWGLINMLASSTGLDGGNAPTPDYIANEAFNNPTCNSGQTSVCNQTYGVTICTCQ